MLGPKGLRSLTTSENAVRGHILYIVSAHSVATYITVDMGQGSLGAEYSRVEVPVFLIYML